jgi:hypothetical protein
MQTVYIGSCIECNKSCMVETNLNISGSDYFYCSFCNKEIFDSELINQTLIACVNRDLSKIGIADHITGDSSTDSSIIEALENKYNNYMKDQEMIKDLEDKIAECRKLAKLQKLESRKRKQVD